MDGPADEPAAWPVNPEGFAIDESLGGGMGGVDMVTAFLLQRKAGGELLHISRADYTRLNRPCKLEEVSAAWVSATWVTDCRQVDTKSSAELSLEAFRRIKREAKYLKSNK